MDKLCFGLVTVITALISLDTLRRLYIDRHRLAKEDLNDYDLAFVWRIVIFLVYPLLNLVALWVSVIACQSFGGYVKNLNYGLLWYQVVPDELSSRVYLIPSLFSGEVAQTSLVLIMLLALLFRPHPFLAMVITYSCTFVLAVNLIVDPVLSMLGFGSAHWQIAIAEGSRQELMSLALIHFVPAVLFLLFSHNESVQMLFATLIRPIAIEKLQKALKENKALKEIDRSKIDNNDDNNSKNDKKSEEENLVALCNLIMLSESAGLSYQASKRMAEFKRKNPGTLLTNFAEAYLSYRRRNYKQSLKLFQMLADSNASLSNSLKAMFLAAAACGAHASRDFNKALNLTERALEFDYHSDIARMIKVDILLKQGKEEKAADELQMAIGAGFDQSIDQTIPIDWERAIKLISDVDTCNNEVTDLPKAAN